MFQQPSITEQSRMDQATSRHLGNANIELHNTLTPCCVKSGSNRHHIRCCGSESDQSGQDPRWGNAESVLATLALPTSTSKHLQSKNHSICSTQTHTYNKGDGVTFWRFVDSKVGTALICQQIIIGGELDNEVHLHTINKSITKKSGSVPP